MNIYFAPLEGITGYIFRNAHHKYFGGIDRYFTPFIVPTHTESMKTREVQDILPEHNAGMDVVPQILTNYSENFMWAARKIQQLGYDEVNLNLGCPSPTVVPKHRGSGFLAYPEELDRFLDEISQGLDRIGMKLSVKTRIGKDSPEEFEDLLKIFNRYPMTELIIHPRIQKDLYRNHPNMEVFRMAYQNSKNPVCYNGDLFNRSDVEGFLKEYPGIASIMLGRGLIANPALGEDAARITLRSEDTAGMFVKNDERSEISTDHAPMGHASIERLDKKRLKAFHDELAERYMERVSGDKNVLFKMKELWYYMGGCFEESEKYMKKIKKSQHVAEYRLVVESLFEEKPLKDLPGFGGMK